MKHKPLLVLLALVVILGTLTGCTTLRRKFIRQKKAKDAGEVFIPVLTPEEYEQPEPSALESYRSHYALVRAYFTDGDNAFGADLSTEKHDRYLLGQLVAHLEQMASLLCGPRAQAVTDVVSRLQLASEELNRPRGVRRNDLLRSAVQAAENEVRRQFRPDTVKGDLCPR